MQPILDAVQRYAEQYEVICRTGDYDYDLLARKYELDAAWDEVEIQVGTVLNKLAKIQMAAGALLAASRAVGVLGATEISIHEELLADALR